MKKGIFLFFVLTLFLSVSGLSLAEENAEQIQKKIKSQDEEIEKIEKEIKESEKKVSEYSGQSKSLKKEISNLNYLNSKLQKAIYEKEKDIKEISNNIFNISEKIEESTNEIDDFKKKIKDSIFAINQFSSTSILEKILAGKQFSDITDDVVRIETIQKVFQRNIVEFTETLEVLNGEKEIKEEKNKKLDKEQEKLSDKKFLLDKNKKDKDYLLKITKNKEKNFKTLLSNQRKEKEEFEKELFDLESKLKFVLDKNSVPKKQVGLFSWPTPKKSNRISQFFGYTDFHSKYATQKRHNGIDLATPTGTEIYSVMSGTVKDTGDATKICRKKQYGKWIAVDHGNGLTSMYAHMSLISVKKGDRISRGQKIGLSGNTGYSFGPHLHFAVYYTAGLKIKIITKNQSGCHVSPQKYKLPIASVKAYADPFSYLGKPEFSRLKPVKYGDRNKHVEELQNMLTYLNIFPRSNDIDGDFGPQTEKYLKKWKVKNDISGNGKSFSKFDLDFYKKQK